MRRYVLSLAALALLFTVVGQAHADLIDDPAVFEWVIDPCGSPGFPCPPQFNDPIDILIGPGVEIPLFNLGTSALDVDVDAMTITYTIISGGGSLSGPFSGPVLTGLDWFGDPDGFIDGFALTFVSDDLLLQDPNFENRVSSIPGGTPNTAGPHSIAINLSGLNVADVTNSKIIITLDTVHTPSGSQPIPEPGTLLLIGSGLVGLGVGARRRGRRK